MRRQSCASLRIADLDPWRPWPRFPIWALLAALASCTPASNSVPPAQSRQPELAAVSIPPPPVAGAGSFVWLEGEQPAFTNVKLNLAGWGNKQFLSGEKWLHLAIDANKIDNELPGEGGLIRFDFDVDHDVKDQGDRTIWARIGFEFARSAFDWRIDNFSWVSVSPDALTSDLMEIDFFCEVAWLKLGQSTLAVLTTSNSGCPGRKMQKGNTRRVLFALDAICIASGDFHPNGRFKPGDDGRDARDLSRHNDVRASRAGIRRRTIHASPARRLGNLPRR